MISRGGQQANFKGWANTKPRCSGNQRKKGQPTGPAAAALRKHWPGKRAVLSPRGQHDQSARLINPRHVVLAHAPSPSWPLRRRRQPIRIGIAQRTREPCRQHELCTPSGAPQRLFLARPSPCRLHRGGTREKNKQAVFPVRPGQCGLFARPALPRKGPPSHGPKQRQKRTPKQDRRGPSRPFAPPDGGFVSRGRAPSPSRPLRRPRRSPRPSRHRPPPAAPPAKGGWGW